MRQVFTVDGGRSCRVECRSSSSSSRKHGSRSSRRWEEPPDNLNDEEEEEFVADAARSVSWGANGLTILARNSFSDSRSSSRDSDPYDLWGMDDVYPPEFDDEIWPRRRQNFYKDNSPRLRTTIPLSYRRSFTDDDGRYESRRYALEPPEDKRRPRERDSFQRERSWERSYSRRYSDLDRDRYDYLERERPVRRLSPPRLQFRDRLDHRSLEEGRKPREDHSRAPVSNEDDDLPPGFGSRASKTELDPRACYRCGKAGHLSGDCPSKGDERSPKRSRILEESRGKTCFTCGFIGHFSFQCPTRSSENAKPGEAGRGKQCYTCGDYGHKSFECPSKSASGEKDSLRRCSNCYETSHHVHECPMFQDAEPEKEAARDEPGNVLYKTKLTDYEKNQYLRENRCFTCGKAGHPYYSCPQSEKRLEFVFFDRESKSSAKLLKNPCWKYVDNDGEVHGPVSLSSLATRLYDGDVQGDYQAHHMYNGNLQPMSVSKLVRISRSEQLISIMSCMPEAAAFLGEDMDAENCKANALSAIQTKIHYDIFETTIRWIVISSMNEALQVYKTARRHWGKNRPPTAEDYLEGDKSGPPQSSDCELSPPAGSRDGAVHSTNAMMLVECAAFAGDSSLEDPPLIALEAIQKSIHARVLEGIRTSVLDATAARFLDGWIQPKKVEVALVVEVLSDEHSGESNNKGTAESSPSAVEVLYLKQQQGEPEQEQKLSKKQHEQETKQKQTEEPKQKQTEEPKQDKQQEHKSREQRKQKQEVVKSLDLASKDQRRQQKERKSSEQQKQRDLKLIAEQKQQVSKAKPSKDQQKVLKPSEQQPKQLRQLKEQTLPEQQKKQTLPEQPKERALPEQQKTQTLAEQPKNRTLPEQQKKQALPEQPALPEQQKKQALTEQPTLPEQQKKQTLSEQPKQLNEGAVDLGSFMQCSKPQEEQKKDKPPELVLRIFRKKKSVVSDRAEALSEEKSRPAKKRFLKL